MGKCIICDKYTKNDYLFCKDCYQEAMAIFSEIFDEYNDEYELKNDYFDIRRKCQTYTLSDKKFDNYVMTMYALAELYQSKFDSDYLINRVKDDIVEIKEEYEIKEYKNYINNNKQNKCKKDTFNDRDFREQWPRNIQCEDGHYVRSKGEKIIDDWLYHHNIVHAYEKSVYMPSNPNDIVLSDFYIPKGDVYIEFWGITDNPTYEARKEYKINLYNKNNYKRIDLEDTHINRIDDIMPRELGKYIKK